MNYHFNLTGSARRPLVKALEDFTKEKATCTKAPTFCYHIGEHITLDNHGVLSINDTEKENSILLTLSEHGFVPEEQENMAVTISLPRNKFTDEDLERLSELLLSKEGIIKHALGIESVAFEVDEEKISFPWFSEMPSSALRAFRMS